MKHLTLEERKKIERLIRFDSAGVRQIARILNRSHSAISEEIRRNSRNRKQYDAESAHRQTLNRQRRQGNKNKITSNGELEAFIRKKLKEDLSPEQIAGTLKRRHRQEIGYVCHETIYSYIYSSGMKREKLHKYLRRHHHKRKHYCERQPHDKTKIPNRISIHQRPSCIDKKTRFGDWENDSMIFSKQRTILSVQVERKSKLVRIHKCPNKTAKETYEAICKTIDSLPLTAFKSMTNDNGTENVLHAQLTEQFGIDTYFCDPYCSWQKGLVENTNMLLRQYLPRWINLAQMTDKQIEEIQEKLNNRPRKSLNWLTPNEYSKLFL